mgnify:CR=1 FL=1
MNWESVWNVLKWVLAALAAGFVGQFGRSLALHLMRRRRARRADASDGSTSGDQSAANAELEKKRLEAQEKIAKKRAKAEVKRAKKPASSEDDAEN